MMFRIVIALLASVLAAHASEKPREEVAAVFPNVQMQVYTSTQSEQLRELSDRTL